jgi:hypothetical protein
MPRKTDSMPIRNPEHDKRVKLTDADRESIRKDFEEEGISIRGLERKYKVSRRLIQFILYPERQEKAKKQYAERRKDGRYYDKEKHRASVKKHRDHKKALNEQGLL